jgi:cytosine/adenosine deaminase-related metal-dependent hydrolase
VGSRQAAATLAWGESLVREKQEALRPGLELRLAAHAPHSVSPELMRLLVAKGGPAAIHLAESPDERSSSPTVAAPGRASSTRAASGT